MIERLLEAERALSVGLLDQAERLYQQAWETDPHNSIAVVGLARVALERGDEPAAQALARRALEIDPDNQAARRMVDRLVEVQTTRAGPAAAVEPPTEATRRRGPHVAPPAAIRTSSSGKGRTTPPPAPGPTLPKARPFTPPASKAPPAPKAPPPQGQRAKPAKRPEPPAPKDGKAAGKGSKGDKEPGLLDRLFGPRR
jgi:tetratricopeptide (TPR) repeat protein